MRLPPPHQIEPSLSALSQRAPARAADQCYHYFCCPDFSAHRSPQHKVLTERARVHLRAATDIVVSTPIGPVTAHVFSPAGPVRRNVLTLHGWTSEGAFMAAFVGPLVQQGDRVVLFDLPAHGRSGPRSASLVDCARAALAVAQTLGPFECVIAHSMGCLIAGLLVDGGPPLSGHCDFERLVLISPPNRMADITGTFSNDHDLTPAAARAFDRRVARVGHRPLARFTTAHLLSRSAGQILVIHSRDDVQIPVSDGMAVAAALRRAELHLEDGLSHRRVLYAPPVLRQVRRFLG